MLDLAEKDTNTIMGQDVHKINKSTKPQKQLKCNCCGKLGHIKPDCFARNMTCYKCNIIGHLANVCRAAGSSKKYQYKKKGVPPKNQHINDVEKEERDSDEVQYSVLSIKSNKVKCSDFFFKRQPKNTFLVNFFMK